MVEIPGSDRNTVSDSFSDHVCDNNMFLVVKVFSVYRLFLAGIVMLSVYEAFLGVPGIVATVQRGVEVTK